MSEIRLKIEKTSETGKKLLELWKRRVAHFEKTDELAKDLGFELGWREREGLIGSVCGFSKPNDTVDLTKYIKPDQKGMYSPKKNNIKVWNRIKDIGNIGNEEVDNVLGIETPFFATLGFEVLDECIIISIYEDWWGNAKENQDVVQIKKSEYYKLKGE